LFWGEQFIAPALVGMLNSTVPIFALAISWFVIPHERVSSMGIVGLALGFVGMGSIFFPTMGYDIFGNMAFWGMMAITLMSLAYSVNTVWARKWGRSIDLVWAIWIQTLSGSVSLLALCLFSGETIPGISEAAAHPKALLGMFYLAFCSTALAMAFYYHLINVWGAVKASSVNYGIPFVAIAVDFFVLGNLPSIYEWIGVALIMLGLIVLHKSKTTVSQKN